MPTRHQHKSFPIVVRDLEVVDAFDVTPGMRRVVLGGEQLGAFENNGFAIEPFRTESADDHVKLVVPRADGSVEVPVQQDDHLDWPAETLARARDYTPRSYDPAAGRLELDFVRHRGGLAAEWATIARPGDRVLVAGPRGTTALPADVDWYLLIGDETALPAIGRWIEELPAGTPVTAVVSVPTSADIQEFEHKADLEITWITRDVAGPDAMTQAVRTARRRTGQVYAWAAGEAGMLRPIRRWLKDELQVDRGHGNVTGYWRAGQSQAESAETQGVLRDRIDLAFPYAVRAAVTLGIAELVADRPLPVEQLAAKTGTQPRGLRKLVRVLADAGLLTHSTDESSDESVGLTKAGSLLTEDFAHTRLDRASGPARLDDAWPGLLHALRTEESGFEEATGRTFWVSLEDDERLEFGTPEETWADDVAGRLGITAEQLVAVGSFGPVPAGGQHYLLSQVLHHWPDAESVALLRRVSEAAGDAPIHLVERVPSPDDHDHDLASDLQLYAAFGGGERTTRECAALAAEAGLVLESAVPFKRELHLMTLRR